MVVLDESKDNFVLDVAYVDEAEAKLRADERKRTGRYLAVTLVLFLLLIGLYQFISNVASEMSALISAATIMFLYLLWLLYAAQRRKHKQKRNDLSVEKQVTTVLENLNNLKNNAVSGPYDNLVYSNSEDDVQRECNKEDIKLNSNKFKDNFEASPTREIHSSNLELQKTFSEDSSRGSSSDVFIRTYSIA